MAFELDFCVGEAFAQIKGNGLSRTWYLPRRSLIDGLKDVLGASIRDGGLLRIKAARLRKPSTTPSVATLLTTEFESLHAEFSAETTFAVSARVCADGSELAGVDDAEIEGLIGRLETLKTCAVAICFLHSKKFPRHEQRVATLLRERGFRVFCSHDEGGNEAARFSATLQDAARFALLHDTVASLSSDLAALGPWTLAPFVDDERNMSGASVLNLDFETFSFARAGERLQPLRIQPLQRIVVGPMNAPTFDTQLTTFGSGPMFLGRSFHPTVFDLLFATNTLDNIDVLKIPQSPRLKNRILEMILTLAKDIESEYRIDSRAVATDLQTLVSELISTECATLNNGAPITVTGGLASVLTPLLGKCRKGLELILANESAR